MSNEQELGQHHCFNWHKICVSLLDCSVVKKHV